jgi:glucose-1-phosphate adenylyltransferase
VEKPRVVHNPVSKAAVCYANMGVYLFNIKILTHYLMKDASEHTTHDFGKDILPKMVQEARVMAYEFRDENRKEVCYWRDIGTLEAYWEANMDLVAVDPLFNLYDKEWPVRTYHGQYPPAKFVFAEEFTGGRLGIALDSIVCNGCIISGGRVERSVVSPNVRINEHAEVHDSVIMENVVIGQHCKIKKAIIDKDTMIPPKTEIGYDPEADRNRFMLTDSGIVVINQEMTSR